MERISVTLKTVTATFLHVQPREEARWRAAPFRGLARWWFRALVGASVPPAEVHAREGALFGTAESPSPVLFRIFPLGEAPLARPRINPGPRGNKRYDVPSAALAAGARIKLEIVPVCDSKQARAAIHQAYAALWVALHFGGVGQRSRRGAGSLQMMELLGVDAPSPVNALDQTGYKAGLEQGLAHVRAILEASTLRQIGADAEFPVLHGNCARAWVVRLPLAQGDGNNAEKEEEVRLAIMDKRRRLDSHQPGSRRPEREFGGLNPRLSSPVWVRVAAIMDGAALLVVTLLRHHGAGAGADWATVGNFVAAMDSNALPVDLGG